MRSPIPALQKSSQYTPPGHRARRHPLLANALRNLTAVLFLAPAPAISDNPVEPASSSDFYITVTANDLYLCGEGFGGIYGCIDEAVAREVESVVISASSDCSVEAVQELINAVHAVGFDRVGVASFSEPDTE